MRKFEVEVIRKDGKTTITFNKTGPTAKWNRILTDDEVKIVVETGSGKRYPEDFKNEDL